MRGMVEVDLFDRYILDTSEIARCRVAPVAHAGVYFLFDGDVIVYVGRSSNVVQRVNSHKNHVSQGLKIFDTYAFIPIADEALREAVERHYIEALEPKYNHTR